MILVLAEAVKNIKNAAELCYNIDIVFIINKGNG